MLVRTWATIGNDHGHESNIGVDQPTLGAGFSVIAGVGLVAESYRIMGDGVPDLGLFRDWTIGNLGTFYGYNDLGSIGGLVSNLWYNYINTVASLFVDTSDNSAGLTSNILSMWGISNEVTLHVEGFGSDVVLTWNGSTGYVVVGNTAFVNYIVSQVGNSIGVEILPINPVPPTSRNIITTLLENEITTLGDNIIHTGA